MQVIVQVCDVGVHRHLVLPLKLCPHLAELGVGAGCRNDVVHDVNVDVVQHNAVPITHRAAHIVHCDKNTVASQTAWTGSEQLSGARSSPKSDIIEVYVLTHRYFRR